MWLTGLFFFSFLFLFFFFFHTYNFIRLFFVSPIYLFLSSSFFFFTLRLFFLREITSATHRKFEWREWVTPRDFLHSLSRVRTSSIYTEFLDIIYTLLLSIEKREYKKKNSRGFFCWFLTWILDAFLEAL